MTAVLPYLIAFAMAATLLILLVGIVSFSVGGKFNARHANNLMRARVAAQGVALALLGLAIWLSST